MVSHPSRWLTLLCGVCLLGCTPPNPWKSTTLEWQTPDTPPHHGNWGPRLPVVHRWAYDYSVPGAADDFIPQTVPVDARNATGFGHGEDKAPR